MSLYHFLFLKTHLHSSLFPTLNQTYLLHDKILHLRQILGNSLHLNRVLRPLLLHELVALV